MVLDKTKIASFCSWHFKRKTLIVHLSSNITIPLSS